MSKYKDFFYCCIPVLLIFSCSRHPENPELETETPKGRNEYRLMMRGGTWDPEQVLKARLFLKQQYAIPGKSTKRDAGLNQWTDLGPGNFSGRVRAIAVHPTNSNILFVAGVSGGIWRSTNSGGSWTPLDDFLPSLSVTSILIHPTGPDTMYLSTGEALPVGTAPGAGIFKSTDGGNTWHLIPAMDPNNLSNYYWINKIVFHPSDKTILFAAAGGPVNYNPVAGCGEIFKITGSGSAIQDLGASSDCLGAGLSVAVSASDPSKIYACFSGGLLISSNGGTSWTVPGPGQGFLAGPGRVEIAIDPANQSRVYALCQTGGATGYLLQTIDAGSTWSTVNPLLPIFDPGTGDNNGWYHNVIWVDPTNANMIIVGGVNLWRSTDQGLSFIPISDWTQYTTGTSLHADQHIIVPAQDYSPANKRVYIGNDGGIASTDNIGTVSLTTGWNLLNGNSLGTTQFYAGGVSGSNPNRIIGGSQDNGTLLSEDNGGSWTHQLGGDGGYCGISPTNFNRRYSSTQNGRFHVFDLIPGQWLPFADLSTTDNPLFIAPLKIYPNDGEKVLYGGESLWRWTVSSLTATNVGPQPVTNRVISSIDISADSSLVVVGYTGGELFKASPPTWSWTPISVNISPCIWGGPITDIAIHPTNHDRIMVSRGGYIDCNVAYTNDGGTTWVNRSEGIPNLQVNCLTWHPDISNWIYTGTDLGVMASEDNGQNWNVLPNFNLSDGPAFVEVTELAFSAASTFGNRTLVAFTYGRGVWKTSFSVRKDIYLDEDCPICGVGTQVLPFQMLEEAEAQQAHGQNWTIDAGDYPTPTKVVITKKIGKINTTNGPVVLGEN